MHKYFNPRESAFSFDITIRAAPLSLIPDALAAVTSAVLLESGLQFSDSLKRCSKLWKLIGIEYDRIAFLLRDLDGYDFILELSGFDGSFRFVL